ncbi:hypothetical protein DRO49_06110 [Candidatus Bathyarchaeota archaeon]|nr:MAG: hypothetical protein DRO49_06110 [Candidatus Bathyarchaeota archaeon]
MIRLKTPYYVNIPEEDEDERIKKIRKKIKSLLDSLSDVREALENFSEPREWKFEKEDYRIELRITKVMGMVARGFLIYRKNICVMKIVYSEPPGYGWLFGFPLDTGDPEPAEEMISWIENHLDEILEEIRHIMEAFPLLIL